MNVFAFAVAILLSRINGIGWLRQLLARIFGIGGQQQEGGDQSQTIELEMDTSLPPLPLSETLEIEIFESQTMDRLSNHPYIV